MRKRSWMVLTVAAALFALLSCQQTPFSGATTASSGNGVTGNVKIAVPNVSPMVAKALGASVQSTSNARALLVVSKVTFELWRAGAIVDTMTTTLDYSIASGPAAEVDWTVPIADGYQVGVKVYNDYLDPDHPVLYGMSTQFSVASGSSVPVTIRPIPDGLNTIVPVALPTNHSTVSTTLQSCFDTGTVDANGAPVFGWRQEKWFKVDATSIEAIEVTATGDSNSAPVILCADENGSLIGMGLAGGMDPTGTTGGPAYWTYGGAAKIGVLGGGMRYIGLVTISNTLNTPITSSVTVKFDNYADDTYESNNTFANAASISSGDVINGVNLDPVGGWDGDQPLGGDWYTFHQAATDHAKIAIVFDADRNPLTLALFDSAGNKLQEVGADSLSGLADPSNPGLLESAEITTDLDTGDYYIWVGNTGPTIGSTYKLQYVAGTGEIQIIVQ